LTAVTGSPFAASTYPNPVTVYTNSSGAFAYVSNMGDGTIWVYSIGSSGAFTKIQIVTTTGTTLNTVTIDPTGPYAYVSDLNTGAVYAFTIDNTSTPGQLIEL
jgi:6-phosphogluconolactonase (cycloisomerase 2 family)